MNEIKYLNVEVLKKIRYKLKGKIYGLRGKERVKAETDYCYLSDHIARLETSAKYHKEVYLKKNKRQYRK